MWRGILILLAVWMSLGAIGASAQPKPADLLVGGPPPEQRVALVIGNAAYQHAPRLDNPARDARDMAAALRRTGFELVGGGPQMDLDKPALESAIREFVNQLQRGSVGMFYYSGHGYEVGGRNYLVPVAANPQSARDVDFTLVDVDLLLRQLRDSDSKLNMVVLDACRNNPFGGRGLRGGAGLAEIRNRPAGTIISFATAAGEVAKDGPAGQNSPFTAALVAAIQQPGLGVLDTFNEVSVRVQRATGKEQQPWIQSTGIQGQFFFVPPGSTVTIQTPAAPGAPAAAAAPGPGGPTPEMMLWSSSGNPALLQAYLDQFPQGVFAGAAKVMIDDLKRSQVAAVPARPDVAPAPPAPPVEAGPEIEEIDGTWITTKRANLRDKPATDAKLLRVLEAGQTVSVTGLVKGTRWYRVASADGKLRGFLFGDTIKDLREAEAEEWQRVKDAKQSAVLVGFLRRFPAGQFAEPATALRDELAKAEQAAQAQAAAQKAEADRLAEERRRAEAQRRAEEERAAEARRRETEMREAADRSRAEAAARAQAALAAQAARESEQQRQVVEIERQTAERERQMAEQRLAMEQAAQRQREAEAQRRAAAAPPAPAPAAAAPAAPAAPTPAPQVAMTAPPRAIVDGKWAGQGGNWLFDVTLTGGELRGSISCRNGTATYSIRERVAPGQPVEIWANRILGGSGFPTSLPVTISFPTLSLSPTGMPSQHLCNRPARVTLQPAAN